MKNEHKPMRNVDASKGQRKTKYEPLHPPSNGSDIHPLSKISTDSIIKDLKECPVGEGPWYENIVLSASFKIFGNLIDASLIRQQVPIQGGFADIELPICIEYLAEEKYRCWESWRRDYEIKSMLVEVKNLQDKATHEDAGQLKNYVDGYARGRLAFLVSRIGFTKPALRTLGEYCRKGYLLLPLHNDNLLELISLSFEHPIKIMRYLRRIETILSNYTRFSL